MRIEYPSTIWASIASPAYKLQTMQDPTLRIATGCTLNMNIFLKVNFIYNINRQDTSRSSSSYMGT